MNKKAPKIIYRKIKNCLMEKKHIETIKEILVGISININACNNKSKLSYTHTIFRLVE